MLDSGTGILSSDKDSKIDTVLTNNISIFHSRNSTMTGGLVVLLKKVMKLDSYQGKKSKMLKNIFANSVKIEQPRFALFMQ